MRFNSIIYLINVSLESDELKNQIEKTAEKRQTFAEKKSVRQSEYYQAAVSGLKPEIVFLVWTLEYQGESKLEYEGKVYSIIRTFEKNGFTELVCEVKVGGS
ncbi:phage head closure protein [Bacillus sp. CGMCC 1.16607]|uniref:phage head closure protein n=1 Tax=Bacillus sp. CGMCC 1.16607 TaxID=3351842 RepID=UPI0036288A9C